jgi:hypothetical protein
VRRVNRRRVILLITCVVLGAIINVAVAWSCAIWSRPNVTKAFALPQAVTDDLWLRLAPLSWSIHIQKCETGPIIPHGSRQETFGLTLDVALVSRVCVVKHGPLESNSIGVFVVDWSVIEYRMGWPIRSVWANAARTSDTKELTIAGAWQFPENITWARIGRGQVLPYRPFWTGFIINSVFFAAIIWLLIRGPFEIRRRVRQYRGQCQACGYPIGSSAMCSECGAPVPRGLRPVQMK